ncbi:MAG: glycerophosphodiester phosphodiesterase family protein [Pseudomonadota bacterium]
MLNHRKAYANKAVAYGVKRRAFNLSAVMALFLSACFLSACAGPDSSTETPPARDDGWRLQINGDLNSFFDCLEEKDATLISAHRGGPRPGYPENAIETFAEALGDGPFLIELDVATSANGVLYLMHDDTLDRTTTGSGRADRLYWREIATLNLLDNDGRRTEFSPPRFADALAFLRERTITQIDFKRSTRFEDVIDEIVRQGAEDRVILIAYSMAQAAKLHRLAPRMMISLSIENEDDFFQAVNGGIPDTRLLGFTGTREANARLNQRLETEGVEVIFGTLGGRRSIDQKIASTGDEKTYASLSQSGVDILATDRPRAALQALRNAERAGLGVCGLSRQ